MNVVALVGQPCQVPGGVQYGWIHRGRNAERLGSTAAMQCARTFDTPDKADLQSVRIQQMFTFSLFLDSQVATTMGIKVDTKDSMYCERAIHAEKGPTRSDTVSTRNLGRRSTRQMYTDLCKIVEPPDPIRAHATAPR